MTGVPAQLELLVEEPSAERALVELVPKIIPNVAFEIRTFQGKHDLLAKLPQRLAGYAHYAQYVGLGVVVLVDRDDDDCVELKGRLERTAKLAGLATLSTGSQADRPVVCNRIVIEELEAWFFGDITALRAAYPRGPAVGGQRRYRDPDAIVGGTWEALERLLNEHGYHRSGLAKIATAADIARYMNVDDNRSRSFQVFRDGLRRLVEGGAGAATD